MDINAIETDIVIVGGGGAGLSAAVAAAEKGAKCLVLEKRNKPGGNMVFAEGFFAAESPAQKRLMIDAKRDDLFEIAMDYSHWTLDPRIIRAFIDKSGDTVRWLEEKGMKLNRIPPMYPNQVPLVWHCPDRGGKEVVELLVRECKKTGVRVLCKTAVKRILVDKNGAVNGVVATSDNTEITIASRCIIIATGGYSGNKRMLKKYYPKYTETIECHGLTNMGDGLRMAFEIGAATEGLGILQTAGPFVGGPAQKWKNINGLAGEPQTIWVNKRGERFINEVFTFQYFESVNALLRQPEMISYTILDESIKQDVIENGMNRGMGIGGGYVVRVNDLEKDLLRFVDEGKAKIANSWEDIADYIGADPKVLKSTIEEYNTCCDQGYDALLNKDRRYLRTINTPPFYAIKCSPAFLGTIGGIKINHNMQVLHQKGYAIPGLFAIGVDTGGWEAETYNVRLSGSTFSFALNSGRIAGENAVRMLAIT